MALLAVGLCAVPVGAVVERSSPTGVAVAASSVVTVFVADAAPEAAVAVIEPGPRDTPAEGAPRRRVAAPARASVQRDAGRALGTPNDGRLASGVRLPVSAPGLYTYNPATQRPPGGADRQWGTGLLVSEVLDLGAWWHRTHGRRARLGIGDLSRPEGGAFLGPVVGHASHQNGLDVDIRLPRRDDVEGPANPANYDRALTQAVVDRLVARGARLVLVGPNLDLHGPPGVVMAWPAHDDHLHVRFSDPDGASN